MRKEKGFNIENIRASSYVIMLMLIDTFRGRLLRFLEPVMTHSPRRLIPSLA